MRKATRPTTGEKYYEYLLVHTDDCLVVSHDPKAVLNSIDAHFKLKCTTLKTRGFRVFKYIYIMRLELK